METFKQEHCVSQLLLLCVSDGGKGAVWQVGVEREASCVQHVSAHLGGHKQGGRQGGDQGAVVGDAAGVAVAAQEGGRQALVRGGTEHPVAVLVKVAHASGGGWAGARARVLFVLLHAAKAPLVPQVQAERAAAQQALARVDVVVKAVAAGKVAVDDKLAVGGGGPTAVTVHNVLTHHVGRVVVEDGALAACHGLVHHKVGGERRGAAALVMVGAVVAGWWRHCCCCRLCLLFLLVVCARLKRHIGTLDCGAGSHFGATLVREGCRV